MRGEKTNVSLTLLMKDKETGPFKKKAVKIVSVCEEAGEASLGKKENTVEQPR